MVRVQAETVARGDTVAVDVDASFDNAGGERASDRLIPIRERYSFRPAELAAIGERGHLHKVDVPLTDRLTGSHLAVAMASTVSTDGQVTVELTETRLVCDPLYSGEPTPQ